MLAQPVAHTQEGQKQHDQQHIMLARGQLLGSSQQHLTLQQGPQQMRQSFSPV